MTFVMKYSREPQSTTTGADTSCVPKWQWDNCRALLQVQSQAVFPNGNGTTAQHYYRCSHKLCSQWRSDNCRALLQVQSQAVFPNGNGTTSSFFTDLPKSALTQTQFLCINRMQERIWLSSDMWRHAVRQTDANVSKKLARSMFRTEYWGVGRLSETSVCNTPDGVELLKSVILTAVAVRIARLHVLWQIVYINTLPHTACYTPSPHYPNSPSHIIRRTRRAFVQKAQLSLCSIKQHAIKMYGGWWYSSTYS